MNQSIVIFALTLSLAGLGSGLRGYSESCNMMESGLQFMSNVVGAKDDAKYEEACDPQKGLFCALGTCSCLPYQEYQESILQKLTGGGKCAGGLGSEGQDETPTDQVIAEAGVLLQAQNAASGNLFPTMMMSVIVLFTVFFINYFKTE